jgi:hypothetical protein
VSPQPRTHGSFAISSLHAVVLRGRAEILPFAQLLEQVAEGFGQCGAMNWLDYFLSGPSIRFKSPWLVLLLAPRATVSALDRNSIVGCTLFSEYALFGWRTGAVSTEDTSGFRTVLAPAEYRAQVAERCASELLNRGAQIALVTYAGEPVAGEIPETRLPGKWASRTRSIGTYLDLLPTYAATLAKFNRTVRFRLGYFRRRLLDVTPCTFVPDVTEELTEEQFLALNRGCLNVVTDEEAALRWRACQLPGGYALGLRTDDGRWLGIIGGWRQSNTTVLHWQLNMSGWEKFSLTTVLRSYFLEHETERKTQRIVFFGGTPHSIRHYFPLGGVTDLILRRDTAYASLLFRLAVLLASKLGSVRRPNFLADTLGDTTLQWQATTVAPRKVGTPIPFTKSLQPGLRERRVRSYPVAVERRVSQQAKVG